ADLAKCRARARFARGLLASSLTWLQAGRPNHHDAVAIRLARTAVKVEPPRDPQPASSNRPSRPPRAPWREVVERLDTAPAEVRHGRSRQFRGASEWHSACAGNAPADRLRAGSARKADAGRSAATGQSGSEARRVCLARAG